MSDSQIKYIESWTFIFKQEEWKNRLLLASVAPFIPLVGKIISDGWSAHLFHRRLRGDNRLPAFDDFGKLLKDGLAPFLITMALGMVFGLGGQLIFGCFFAVLAGIGGILQESAGPEAAGMLLLAGQAVVMLGFMAFGWLAIVPVQAALLRAEVTGDFMQAVSPGPLFRTSKTLFWPLLKGSFVHGFISTFLFMLGYICCFIGMFPAIALVSIATSEFRCQVYRQYLADGGEPFTRESYIDGGPLEMDMGEWDPT